ncbi:MAG: 6-bladed beta-propeller [Barnesiella sp.]|nr:6-bladed beta-propeller [Barnesiella sp.]
MKNSILIGVLTNVIAGLCSGCSLSSGDRQPRTDSLTWPDIDLLADYPETDIYLQDIGTVDYIPLELTDSSLLGNPRIIMTERYIITSNSADNVIVFNRDGSYSHSFNKVGQAPFEYTSIDQLAVDPLSHTIYVIDKLMFRAQIYDLYGNYIGSRKLPANLFQDVYFLDKGMLLGVDRKDVSIEDAGYPKQVNKEPFFILDCSAGNDSIYPLHYRLENPVSDLYLSSSGDTSFGISQWIFPISRIGDYVFVSEALEDTIYTIHKDARIPVVAKHHTSKNQIPILTAIDGINSRFLFINSAEKLTASNNLGTPDAELFAYDNDSPGWKKARLINRDIDDLTKQATDPQHRISASNHTLLNGYMGQLLSAERICDLRDSGVLKGELLKLSEGMTHEDNPVLLLLRLNE